MDCGSVSPSTPPSPSLYTCSSLSFLMQTTSTDMTGDHKCGHKTRSVRLILANAYLGGFRKESSQGIEWLAIGGHSVHLLL
jgi:hypothetical protein